MLNTIQFCVALQREPGMLAELCSMLRGAGVNIGAIFVSGDQECCWVNFVASDVEAAHAALSQKGYHFFTEDVVALKVENRPGELERIAGRLSDAGINIDYVYGSGTDTANFTLIMRVSDVEGAANALGERLEQGPSAPAGAPSV